MKAKAHTGVAVAALAVSAVAGGALLLGGAATAQMPVANVQPPAPSRIKASPSANLACDKATIQAAAPADTTITAVVHLAAPEPDAAKIQIFGNKTVPQPLPHCRIDGYVTNTNPGPNRNNFRLQLPDRNIWAGRYYFVGLGGSAGYVPTDSQVQTGNPILAGFAVAGTDTGHQGSGQDFSFMTDPVKALDHIHRGAHVVAVSTQQITRRYYGVDKMYRYHTGCSGGGRMGAEAYSRYDDYDGVLIGNGISSDAAAMRANFRDGNGFVEMSMESNREPGAWLSPAKLRFVEQKVTAVCDATDGAIDEMVWDRKLCKVDFNQFKCTAGDGPTCLTQPEITTINNLLKDPRRPITNMSGWTQYLGSVPPPWSAEQTPENLRKTSAAYITMTSWARTYLRQPDRNIVTQPLTDAEMDRIADERAKTGHGLLQDATLMSAERAGRKTIMYHGVSDPVISSYRVEDAYNGLVTARGGDLARVQKFARLYFTPGNVHCGGGTGPQDHVDRLLAALIDWVENGKDPGGVVLHRGADRVRPMWPAPSDASFSPGAPPGTVAMPIAAETRSRDFLVCPYPSVAVFDRRKSRLPGAVFEAANWSCKRQLAKPA